VPYHRGGACQLDETTWWRSRSPRRRSGPRWRSRPPALAGATARQVMQRSVTASRRVLLNFPPNPFQCQACRRPLACRIVEISKTHVKKAPTPFRGAEIRRAHQRPKCERAGLARGLMLSILDDSLVRAVPTISQSLGKTIPAQADLSLNRPLSALITEPSTLGRPSEPPQQHSG